MLFGIAAYGAGRINRRICPGTTA